MRAAIAAAGTGGSPPITLARSQPTAARAPAHARSMARAASLRDRGAKSAQLARQPDTAAACTDPSDSVRNVVACLGAGSTTSPLTISWCPVEKLK